MSKESVKQYIEINPAGTSPTGVTRVWNVVNSKKQQLIGTIKWWGGFRKYVFYVWMVDQEWILFDSDCMRMIADFLDSVNKRHAQDKKESRMT